LQSTCRLLRKPTERLVYAAQPLRRLTKRAFRKNTGPKNGDLHEFLSLLFSDPVEDGRGYLFSSPNRETIWRPKLAESVNPLPHSMVKHSGLKEAHRTSFYKMRSVKAVTILRTPESSRGLRVKRHQKTKD
jgi:hypothetical protein